MHEVICAAPTPFTDEGEIDLRGAERLYQWVLDCELDGFFLFGNMGEWSVLTPEMTAPLTRLASELAGDRAATIVGINDVSLRRMLQQAEQLSDCRHTHWAAMLPLTPGGVHDPVSAMHNLADRLDRPLYYYHLPAFTGAHLSQSEWRDLLAHPGIVGVKNSAGDVRSRKELLRLREELDFALYEGHEWAADEAFSLGLDGVVAGFGAMGARLFKAIARAAAAGDAQLAQSLQLELIGIMHAVYGEEIRHPRAGQKYGLQLMGLLPSAAVLIESHPSLREIDRTRIRECVARYPQWFQV